MIRLRKTLLTVAAVSVMALSAVTATAAAIVPNETPAANTTTAITCTQDGYGCQQGLCGTEDCRLNGGTGIGKGARQGACDGIGRGLGRGRGCARAAQ